MRKDSCIFLVGPTISELIGAKLPSNRQVLSLFYHQHKDKGATLHHAAISVIGKVLPFWERARLPTKEVYNAITKLEKLVSKLALLKKSIRRRGAVQKEKEDNFSDSLDDLFDIAHSTNEATNPVDRKFLACQRKKGREGCMLGVDQLLTEKEVRSRIRKQEEEFRRAKACKEAHPVSCTHFSDESESEEVYHDELDTNHYNFVPEHQDYESTPHAKRGKFQMMTPGVTEALDRTKTTDRAAVFILTKAAEALGHDPKDININRTSIHSHRVKHRALFAEAIKTTFAPNVPLTVHWDGKLLMDLTGNEYVDRLPIIVTGVGVQQLLGVPKIGSGTGLNQATAVMAALKEWGISERVAAISFDTTASNTGHLKGACVILQQQLDRELLHLACRHHIFELIIGSVFVTCTTVSSGPDVALFIRFKNQYQFLVLSNYQSGVETEVLSGILGSCKESIVCFAKEHLSYHHPRDDYQEFLELVIIFLGEAPGRGVHFRSPGAMHHGRWMSKVIYSLKIWLFRGQFDLTNKEKKGLERICTFIVKIYVKTWFTAPIAAAAPKSDLQLVKDLKDYAAIDPEVSKAALKKIGSHLWYLSEDLVGLSLFDDDVRPYTKTSIVKSMFDEGLHNPGKRAIIDMETVGGKELQHFASKQSLLLFTRLGLSTAILEADPNSWKERDDYRRSQNIISNLEVINDEAERGVSLIQGYNRQITHDECQLQFLLNVVKEHRKKYPNALKRTQMNH